MNIFKNIFTTAIPVSSRPMPAVMMTPELSKEELLFIYEKTHPTRSFMAS
jgi:hypothetical protein